VPGIVFLQPDIKGIRNLCCPATRFALSLIYIPLQKVNITVKVSFSFITATIKLKKKKNKSYSLTQACTHHIHGTEQPLVIPNNQGVIQR
jgi:hypothetical protein